MDERTCVECGASLAGKRSVAKYCGQVCARRNHYVRNREHELAGMARWRADNREYDRQRWAEYYASNAERLSQVHRAAYYANQEADLARAAEWRRQNPGRGDAWRKANPEKWALRNRENQRRRRRTDGPVDYAAILAEHGMTCHICGEDIPDLADLHFDHVIPLSKGGPHSAENIRPSHARCNLRKGARLVA